MPDITKCKGDGCTLKAMCYRHTAKDSMRQSWFFKPPYTINDNGNVVCDMFWGESSHSIMNQLKSIISGKKNK